MIENRTSQYTTRERQNTHFLSVKEKEGHHTWSDGSSQIVDFSITLPRGWE
jgi:hypothetical protein